MEVLRNIYFKALKGSADVDELLAAARQKGIKTTRKQVEEFQKVKKRTNDLKSWTRQSFLFQ
jgi:hypothetical protein